MAYAVRKLDVLIGFAHRAPLATLIMAFASFQTGNFVQVIGNVLTVVLTTFVQPRNWVHIIIMAL